MSRTTHAAFADTELLDLLADDPELLAIADAITATQSPTRTARRLVRPTILAAGLAAAAAVAITLVAPWSRSHGSLSDVALAALGSQPVVHVVTETPTDASLVDIATGDATPVLQQDEIWYDADRGLRRDLIHDGPTIVDDVLETPQGGFTSRGIVYDCTWIAAHPVEATKARVSCNASGDNGTTPHVVPRPKPTLDPGLAGFADSYRDALVAGSAREDGTGAIDGTPVDWLAFATTDGSTERVALDQATHKPVRLQGEHLDVRIASIETVAYDAADFARPTPSEVPLRPSVTRAGDGPAVGLDGAAIAAAYPGAVWAGTSIAGLPLVHAELQPLSAGFANHEAPTATGRGIELGYGSLAGSGRLDRTKPHVLIQEAPSATLATMAGLVRGSFPVEGTLYTSGGSGFTIGALQLDGTYLIIQAQHVPLLSVARALTHP